MTGPDYDEDEPEFFRAAPHPDDRLWRHPSEMAAMAAAHANAETIKVPAVKIDEAPTRSRLQTGLMVAAGVVAVGATALTLGVLTTQTQSDTSVATASSVDTLVAAAVPETTSQLERSQSTRDSPSDDASASGDTTPIGASTDENQRRDHEIADGRYCELAWSLPRIQAATTDGMRDGSGLFITDNGHIATSAGLIDGADYVLAWTDDGRRWKANVVAVDSFSDVAILHIQSEEWPAIALGSDTDLWSGQSAFAVNHSSQKLQAGSITTVAPQRVLVDQRAAVAGSAILDDTGAVIGMVNEGASHDHATPAWLLEQVAVDLITTGETTHAWLGAAMADSPDHDMVMVDEVLDGSPADQAGLRAGDAIDTIDGATVTDAASLWRAVQMSEPGDDVVLTVTRYGNRRLILATLGEAPE